MPTPEELLAILPDLADPPPALRSLPPLDPPGEVVEARVLREATLPTTADLLRSARRSSRLLGFLAALLAPAAGRAGAWLLGLGMVGHFAVGPAVALYPALAGTVAPFGTANLIVGTVGVALTLVAAAALTLPFVKSWALISEPARHKLHALLRWQDLLGCASGENGSELCLSRPSALVEHVPGDPNCPCASVGCAGGLAFWEGMYAVPETAIRNGLHFLSHCFFPLWTPMVALASVFWSTWYTLILGILILAFTLGNLLGPASVLIFRRPKPPLMELSRRLQCRAVDVLLAGLLTDYRTNLGAISVPRQAKTEAAFGNGGPARAGDEVAASPEDVKEPFLFDFLGYLSSSWIIPLRMQTASVQRFSLVLVLFFVPAFIANLAVGRCVPAWELAFLVWWLFIVVSFLVELAAANARIGAVCAVIRAGSAEALRLLSLAASSRPRPDRDAAFDLQALQQRLSALSRRLDAVAASAEPARFAGIKVTYGTTRALVVSLFTVLFALWGLLNGVGIRVVLDSYCPAGL